MTGQVNASKCSSSHQRKDDSENGPPEMRVMSNVITPPPGKVIGECQEQKSKEPARDVEWYEEEADGHCRDNGNGGINHS